MQLGLALLLASTARAAKTMVGGEAVNNAHLALLKERWLAATDRSGGVWGPALTNWSIAARRERKENGKFLIAFADDYGLGNRINIVTSTLALAMATGRSLIVLWPHTDCRHTNHGDCDPTSINDLFVENETRAQWGVGSPVRCIKSNCRGASDLHAIDAMPARRRGGLVSVHPTHWLIYAQVTRTRPFRDVETTSSATLSH